MLSSGLHGGTDAQERFPNQCAEEQLGAYCGSTEAEKAEPQRRAEESACGRCGRFGGSLRRVAACKSPSHGAPGLLMQKGRGVLRHDPLFMKKEAYLLYRFFVVK